MKRLFYFMLSLVAFVGCTENSTDESTPQAFINLSATNYVVGHEGGEVVVNVKSNVEFDVRISADWIQQTSTNTTESFTFNILANESGNDREGTISFVSNDKLITQTVSVKQNHDTTKPAYNEIWYTSTDGYAINPVNTVETFGATIVSNTYDAKARKGVITFDGNVTKIGERAFARELAWGATSKLESITLPNSVTEIGTEAFMSCNNLINITISENVTTIGDFAFSGCSRLASVTIPHIVTTIGKHAFSSCDNLINVIIPSAVIEIHDYAFLACNSLQEVYFNGDNAIEFGVDVFKECDNLKKIHALSLAAWCNINPPIPYNMEYNLYLNGHLADDIEITDNILLGAAIFKNCISLTNVTIGNNVLTIGNSTFCGCSNLTNVTIGDGVTSIGDYAFENCNRLKSVIIGDSVTEIGNYAFSGCCNLPSITIPDGVTEIRNHAFYGCKGLTNITIPDSVTNLGADVFSYCSNLTDVTIGNGVTEIKNQAFANCSSLASIKIGNGIETIEPSAFEGCNNLQQIYISDIVAWCKIKFNSRTGNPFSLGAELYLNEKLVTDIVIPDNVISISDYAFFNCNSVKSVTILDGVTSIGKEAFEGCDNLTTVTIGKNVTSIGYAAFNGKNSLLNVYCKATTPPATTNGNSWSAFANNPEGRKIYVPTESVEKYKTAEGWSVYADDIVGYDF